jgi:hypothetical protein
MSSLMLLSVREKKDILKNLVSKRSKKFNKEYAKVLKIVQENDFLKNYKEKLESLKDDFKSELNSIDTHDVDWETHERKGAEIEKRFNKKLLNIKYEINSILNSFNDLKKVYEEYERIYENLIKELDKNDIYKNLKSEIKKKDFSKIANISQIAKEKEQIKKELEKIEEVKKSCKIISSYDFNNSKEKNFIPINELETTLGKIKSLNQKEYERIKNLEINDKLKLKEAKVIYQRLVYTQIFKEEINDILDDTPEYLSKKFEKLIHKDIIYKDEYEKLLDEYYNQESDEVPVDKIVDAFEELGYKFEDVVLDEKGYIDTDEKEYKLAYRMENGNFSLAFTRFVDENTTINEYEKEKDKQKAKKWCSDFKKISKLLEKQGIELKKEAIKEPEEVEIRYEKIENREKLMQVNQKMME